jgi:hypothetical protein
MQKVGRSRFTALNSKIAAFSISVASGTRHNSNELKEFILSPNHALRDRANDKVVLARKNISLNI